jgi:hypothetical protein
MLLDVSNVLTREDTEHGCARNIKAIRSGMCQIRRAFSLAADSATTESPTMAQVGSNTGRGSEAQEGEKAPTLGNVGALRTW